MKVTWQQGNQQWESEGIHFNHKHEKQEISESMFVITLVKSIQELSKQNEEMKLEINELKKDR